jgi:hypothetical protein
MTTPATLKRQLTQVLEALPEEALPEVALFLDYLQYKTKHRAPQATPYKPIALGGLWAGRVITDEDIAEVRREMWANFGAEEI